MLLQHGWYLQPRPIPHVPCFSHCPVPARLDENVNENARLTMAYFRAWTLDAKRGTDAVPHVRALRGVDESWEHALRTWLRRLPCEETKQYIGNFMSVYRVRPAVEGQENSDDDAADTALHVTPTDLADALQTKVSAHGKRGHVESKEATDSLVAEAFRTAEKVWATGRVATGQAEKTKNAWDQVPAEAAIRAAKRKQGNPAPDPTRGHETNPAVTLGRSEAEQVHNIHAWLHSLDSRKCNAEQQAFCRKVAERVLTEMQEDANPPATHEASEPLRWALHGGPGTGKSYTLNLVRRELFEQILGWQQGVHFQVVTLQAVMAEQLDGDTIHHALGLNWNGAGNGISEAKLLELCATTLQWRWLFIDEISMVSAELLARLELRCRELVRDISTRKFARNRGDARCFGGLNVCVSGDLWQLPPPRGTFLGEVPWEMITKCSNKKLAQTIHGQELIWGYGGQGIQGMTELVQCERTHDAWLQELQDQLRHGQLSDENHAFLHGRMTKTPGSVCKGRVTCGQANCQRLMQQQAPASIVGAQECDVCKSERTSKALVLHGKPGEACFAGADAILPTNAVKYHVNKLRAHEWAKQHQERMRYAIGQDRMSSAALREKPDLMNEKLEWLQRHDQECGGLYGVLPLCMGFPVRATDHIDRAKGILRGCRGVVVGWSQEHVTESCAQDNAIIWNTLPVAVYVRFDTAAKWAIDGLQQANVYPVSPQRKQWHLDKHRQRPVLRVTRRQYPLAPAFAVTAHAAQGQTAKGQVVADLHIGPNGDPLTAYVAVTRVTGRNKLAILRPFDPKPYQQGTRLGRALLLRVWRREEIDWEVLRAKYVEEKPCAECSVQKRKNEYTVGQWKRNDDKRICKECIARHVDNGQPWQCSMCCCWRSPAQFPAKHQKASCAFYRVCLTCKETKACGLCGKHLEEKNFSKGQWRRTRGGQRVCRACQRKGQWTCAVCGRRVLQTHFSLWAGKHKGRHGRQQCNMCIHMKHAKKRTHTRLKRRREKVAEAKVAKVLQDARAEIQQRQRKQRAQGEESAKGAKTIGASPTGRKRTPGQICEPEKHIQVEGTEPPRGEEAERSQGQEYDATSARSSKKRANKRRAYECPYCRVTIYSTVESGNVQATCHCDKQFRVRGSVVARNFAHACPKCGQQIQSSKETGRIQSTHKTPAGKPCPKRSWIIN